MRPATIVAALLLAACAHSGIVRPAQLDRITYRACPRDLAVEVRNRSTEAVRLRVADVVPGSPNRINPAEELPMVAAGRVDTLVMPRPTVTQLWVVPVERRLDQNGQPRYVPGITLACVRVPE